MSKQAWQTARYQSYCQVANSASRTPTRSARGDLLGFPREAAPREVRDALLAGVALPFMGLCWMWSPLAVRALSDNFARAVSTRPSTRMHHTRRMRRSLQPSRCPSLNLRAISACLWRRWRVIINPNAATSQITNTMAIRNCVMGMYEYFESAVNAVTGSASFAIIVALSRVKICVYAHDAHQSPIWTAST